jgi:hypothetical protein
MVILFLPLCSLPAASDFVSSSGVDEVRRQIEKLPKDKIWWTVNGRDMAWNNKNLQRIFPTVTVYRDGPVRELPYRLMPEISAFPIDTPQGKMPFIDFLQGDQSTTMGIVVVHKDRIIFERLLLCGNNRAEYSRYGPRRGLPRGIRRLRLLLLPVFHGRG